MFRKLLNTIVLAFQWGFSLMLAIYLLVPGYTFEDTPYSGDYYYNPYAHWNDHPLIEMIADGNHFYETSKGYKLYLSALDFAAPVYVLDTVSHQQMGKFFLGYSKHDIQYLIFKYRKNHTDPLILLKPDRLDSDDYTPFKGVNLIKLSDSHDEAFWDTLLTKGQPVFAYADATSGFSKNLVEGSDFSTASMLEALKKGKNLMAFSNKNLADTNLAKIPVIRKIEWHQNTIHIDLSQPGIISLITSGFSLDTLTQSLHLKLIEQDWMRFKVDFKNEHITYLSNPFFRYDGTSIKPQTLKSNNLRSIFYNLAWLIGIILSNYLINKFRRTFIYHRN